MSQQSTSAQSPEPAAYPDLPRWQVPRSMAPTNHGRTVASWVLVLGCAVGAVVAAIGFIVPSMVVIAVGGAIIAVSLVLSVALRLMGKGQPPVDRPVPDEDDSAHLRS